MATSPNTKRIRLDPTVSSTLKAIELNQVEPPIPPPRSRLESLPVELLSEVLSYMPTPNDILNVTRTSRFMCHTLLNKGNTPIWVAARKNSAAGVVPEPPAGWSEPAHAAFLFDGGRCEVCIQLTLASRCVALRAVQMCGHFTKRMLVSYAVQARLCGNVSTPSPSSDCRSLNPLSRIYVVNHSSATSS